MAIEYKVFKFFSSLWGGGEHGHKGLNSLNALGEGFSVCLDPGGEGGLRHVYYGNAI